jgi:hypothetical protein
VDLLFVSERTGEQYATALRSLTAELSRGAKAGKWFKMPGTRGQYRFNRGDIEFEDLPELRSPKKLKRPQFEKMSYIDISIQVLSLNPTGLSLEDLGNEIFEFDNDLEREKALNSLSVELNRAIREKRLEKSADQALYILASSQTKEVQDERGGSQLVN